MHIISASYKNRRVKIPVGQYSSVVTDISYDANYVDGEAFKISYTLTSADGTSYSYSEIFHNTMSNPRTAQFFEYLDSAGVPQREDGLPDLVGFNETLVLKRQIGYSKPVIEEREPA